MIPLMTHWNISSKVVRNFGRVLSVFNFRSGARFDRGRRSVFRSSFGNLANISGRPQNIDQAFQMQRLRSRL